VIFVQKTTINKPNSKPNITRKPTGWVLKEFFEPMDQDCGKSIIYIFKNLQMVTF